MRIVTFVSPSHERLFREHFIASLPISMFLDLFVESLPQHVCPSGEFMSDGFKEMMQIKMLRLRSYCLKVPWPEEVALYCDADVRFYEINSINPDELLGDNDVLFANDGNNTYGCGVILFRPRESVRLMFQDIADETIKDGVRDDQEALNRLMADGKIKAKYGYLPNSFYTTGLDGGRWPEYKPEIVQCGMVLHHANFTVGIQNKLDLLNHVWQLHQRLTN